MIYVQNERQALLCGDSLTLLRKMPSNLVNCCVTSPPYFGLRDYGMDGQIGLEQTPDEYISKLVDVFREVKRVLRDDGTLWLNIGDSYAAQRGGTHQPAETLAGGKGGKTVDGARVNRDRHDGYNPTCNAHAIGLKHKDLIGIPWRVAFALQADGWYLRQDIIWHKPNPMPESVKDRCTKAHEYIFLLSKSAKYYFDSEAIQEPLASSSVARLSQDIETQAGSDRVPGKTNGRMKAVYTKPYTGSSTKDYAAGGAQDASETKKRIVDKILSGEISGRNKRSVWTVTTKPFKGAHFATFPPDLIEPCVLAGCPENGVVLDPFNGAGTVGVVSFKNNRNYVGVELNPEYCRITVERWAKNGNQN
jgi:DNA modification methylase